MIIKRRRGLVKIRQLSKEFVLDRKIDPSQLDVEACQQADLFFKYAESYVKARAAVDLARMRLDVTEAGLAISCRESPEDFGLIKVSEGGIDNAVKSHHKYIQAAAALIKAREKSLLLEKMVSAMEMRKRMLEVLITLHGQQYFAGPSVPRNLVAAFQDAQERREVSVIEKQRTNVHSPRKKAKKRRDTRKRRQTKE